MIDLGAGFELELTGRENVILNGTLLGHPKTQCVARLPEVVSFAELEEFVDAPLRTYSSGMVARLAFAVATDVRPDVLIVDEVLSVGDAAFRKKSFARIERFRAEGVTIVLVSHDLEMVTKMCDRVAWLAHGSLVKVGPPADIMVEYRQRGG